MATQQCRIYPKRLTFYGSETSPFAHRVLLALHEARAPFKFVEIDINTPRPEWYTKYINPEGMVPALVVGGPEDWDGQGPLPDGAVAIRESTVILEYLAEIFPDARLLPADPALRAQARLFTLKVDAILKGYYAFMFKAEPADEPLKALEALQSLLPAEGFAAGEYSIADIAALTILVYLDVVLRSGKGFWDEAARRRLMDESENAPRFARLRKYKADGLARENMRETWSNERKTKAWGIRYEYLRSKQT